MSPANGEASAAGAASLTAKVLIGFVILWLLLDRSAAYLGSFRGEAGLAVCTAVLVAAIISEGILFERRPGVAASVLGLGVPNARGLVVAIVLALALVLFLPAYGLVVSVKPALRADWAWLALGMFAQGGVAEETVFRGFLFRHFREGRSFWRAALLSAVPFTAVHLLLFATLDVPLALASVVLATASSFPLARLFEIGGNSIWPPAILHFAIQAPIKLVVTPETGFGTMALAWMAVSALLPWLVFAVAPRGGTQAPPR